MPGSHRLFVAVDPPPAVAGSLAAWARAQRGHVPGLRPLAPEAVHLTLAFLGERPAGDVDAVAAAMAAAVAEWTLADPAAGTEPIELELGPPAWLPPRGPRALAVDVRDPDGRLAALRGAVVGALEAAIGFERETRRFRPHLTAARVRGRPGAREPLDPSPAGAFTVDDVVLYRSFLDPGGARYDPLVRVPLR